MGKSNPVVIATRSFASQTEANAFFSDILRRYNPGDKVSGDDALHLTALLERHLEYQEKVGVGVDHFAVMRSEHGTNCFRIVRKDGSGTDFSIGHCIKQRAPLRKTEVSQALRRAVRFDIYRARDKFFAENKDHEGKVTCAVSGEKIAPDESHIDHLPPTTFEVLVSSFLAARGMTLDQVPLTSGTSEQTTTELTDPDLAEAFRAFHARAANLDVVKKSVNLAQSAQNRIREGRVRIA
jgi:hypothetical protein